MCTILNSKLAIFWQNYFILSSYRLFSCVCLLQSRDGNRHPASRILNDVIGLENMIQQGCMIKPGVFHFSFFDFLIVLTSAILCTLFSLFRAQDLCSSACKTFAICNIYYSTRSDSDTKLGVGTKGIAHSARRFCTSFPTQKKF